MGNRGKGKRLPSHPQEILRIFLHSVYFLSNPLNVLKCLINTDISRSCGLHLQLPQFSRNNPSFPPPSSSAGFSY